MSKQRKKKLPKVVRQIQAGIELATVELKDPFSGEYEQKLVNTKECAYMRLFTYGKIDATQKLAADKFRALFEARETGRVKAIDYERVKVDSQTQDLAVSDRAIDAAKKLDAVRLKLGNGDYSILERVCGYQEPLSSLIQFYTGRSDASQKAAFSEYVSHTLQDLAVFWGMCKRIY